MSSDTPRRIEAVFNASPLILLDFLGYAFLLPQLYDVIIPPQVAAELTAKPGEPGGQMPSQLWVQVQVPNGATLEQVRGELAADPGEEAAVALALDRSTMVVLDDLKARAYARRRFIRLTGTIGILLRIHRLGLARLPLKAEIEALEARGMHVSAALRKQVLSQDSS
jgi:predicted nucleic acid-binding protein